MDFLKIAILSVSSIGVLFILAKLLGYRQISQLSYFDYVVGISIGSIAAEMATNIDLEWWKGILAMSIYALIGVALDIITQKSIPARRIIDGKPYIIIDKGSIDKKALKKARLDLDNLLSIARIKGYFDISDIDYAIMETSGEISFLPKPLQRELNPKDFNFAPERHGICYNVILDGELINENLNKSGVSNNELMSIIGDRALLIEDILLATIDESGKVSIFEKSTGEG